MCYLTQIYDFSQVHIIIKYVEFFLAIGKGYCHWTEQHGSGDNRRTVRYTGREQLFHFVSPLFGSLPNSNGSKVMLTQGQSTFPFVFTIPPNLPSSFEGRSGHIRFELKGNYQCFVTITIATITIATNSLCRQSQVTQIKWALLSSTTLRNVTNPIINWWSTCKARGFGSSVHTQYTHLHGTKLGNYIRKKIKYGIYFPPNFFYYFLILYVYN